MDNIRNNICRHYERLTFDKCYNCDNGRDTSCDDFIGLPIHRQKSSNAMLDDPKHSVDDYIPMMVRKARLTKILPKNYQHWLRQYRKNQDGAI